MTVRQLRGLKDKQDWKVVNTNCGLAAKMHTGEVKAILDASGLNDGASLVRKITLLFIFFLSFIRVLSSPTVISINGLSASSNKSSKSANFQMKTRVLQILTSTHV